MRLTPLALRSLPAPPSPPHLRPTHMHKHLMAQLCGLHTFMHLTTHVSLICHKTCRDGSDCTDLFPSDLQSLPADRLVAPFLTLCPELCMVMEDDEACPHQDSDGSEADGEEPDEKVDLAAEAKINGVKPEIVGYACAAINAKEFYKKQEIAWIPEMCLKYPQELEDRPDLSPAAKECVRHFHSWGAEARAPEALCRSHPALLACGVLPAARDPLAPARLLACLLAALRAHGTSTHTHTHARTPCPSGPVSPTAQRLSAGVSGVHVCINSTDQHLHQFYTKLGFAEAARDGGRVFLARTF
ncbi:unnamed protein product, partial [Iphiclides podalirius]